MNQRTQKNLVTAMHGEAFAFVKYMLFAEQARKNGHTVLADLFEKTANIERFEHLAEEAALAGLVGSDADNLSDAIEGESYEVETMYKEFAEQAAADGDQAAASRFAEVRGDEIGHRDAFKAALIQFKQGSKR
jgi:rubrerythrin